MMIKEVVIGLFSNINPMLAERYYLRSHGPDVVYASGPWLRRYVTYRTYEPPPDAIERFNAKKGRYTELWFTEEDYKTRPGMASFTPAPWSNEEEDRANSQAQLMVPVTLTEDFLGKEPRASETPIMRWIYAIRYPDGVPVEEGEDWYLNVHVKEVNRQPGLLHHVSYRGIGAEQIPPPPGVPVAKPWIRITEQWFRDMDAWRKAVIESDMKYTPPPWGGKYPYFKILSNFVHYRYDIDFLKGNYNIP